MRKILKLFKNNLKSIIQVNLMFKKTKDILKDFLLRF